MNMNNVNDNLEETKKLNQESRQKSASKQGTSNMQSVVNAASTGFNAMSSMSADLHQARQANAASNNAAGMSSSNMTSMDDTLEQARQANAKSASNASSQTASN